MSRFSAKNFLLTFLDKTHNCIIINYKQKHAVDIYSDCKL